MWIRLGSTGGSPVQGDMTRRRSQRSSMLAVASSKIKIIVTKSESLIRICGDRDEIVQVIQNLVHNAIKYGKENGRVEVAVSRVLDGTPPQPRACRRPARPDA